MKFEVKMKRIVCALALLVLLLVGNEAVMSVSAATVRPDVSQIQLNELRAGGGSGGGGGGGIRLFRRIRRSYRRVFNDGEPEALDYVICAVGIVVFPGVVVVDIALFVRYIYRKRKRIRVAKDMLKKLSNTDSAWKYDKLVDRVTRSYFAIQKAWSKGNMESAKQYMSDRLFDEFQQKLDKMNEHNERNVLKNVALHKYYAAAVYDSPQDEYDNVWFYIGGSMVDYIYNSELKKITQGSTKKQSFVEYWKYVRNQSGEWVLDKIVQKNDFKNLPFNDYVR